MSVLIEGMEMPDTCTRCDYIGLNVAIGCKVVTGTNGRADNCPLTEVPEPHGRLGDLDALPWFLANTSVKYATYEDWEMLCDAIAAAPTIIPSSEEAE